MIGWSNVARVGYRRQIGHFSENIYVPLTYLYAKLRPNFFWPEDRIKTRGPHLARVRYLNRPLSGDCWAVAHRIYQDTAGNG